MSNPRTRQRPSIEARALHIGMIRGLILGRDGKLCSLVRLLIQVNCGAGKERASQDVDFISRTYRIEPESTEDIPRRHLAYIVISADTVHIVVVGTSQYTARPFPRQPGLTRLHKQIGDMVHRLVGVVVVVVPPKRGRCLLEEVIDNAEGAIMQSHSAEV
jgi:hypothetical protein